MKKPLCRSIAAASLAFSGPLHAEVPRPGLLVAISIDQYSADLFAAYRAQYTGGLKRLQQGVVFPSAYHAHAATETCPGHATLLTGVHPAHSGIIANNWYDAAAARADKNIYCAEDESVPGSSSKEYSASLIHLRVPTLGDRMKLANPGTRVFSVSGKDRAAMMMAGKSADQTWWWGGNGFVSYSGRKPTPVVSQVSDRLLAGIAVGLPAPVVPGNCIAAPLAIGGGKSVGNAPEALAPGDTKDIRFRPELDQATLDIAAGFVEAEKLGKGSAPDLLTVSLSVTDYVGHRFGPGGVEMCVQMMALDAALGHFLDRLDATGIRYAVMLSADHGGVDLPERDRQHGATEAARVSPGTSFAALNKALGAGADPLILGDSIAGDVYVAPRVKGAARIKLISRAQAWLNARPDVAATFTARDLRAVKIPTKPPESWSLAERAAASFYPGRSGDLIVLLKPRTSPIADPLKGYVTTHGSPWDYDRRVPLLFWWPGVTGFEQPASVMTVDVIPSLAGLIGLRVDPSQIDGHCLDLDASQGTTCP